MKKLAIIFLLAGLLGCYSREPVKTGLEEKPLPSFDLFLADSTTYFNTNSIPAGKPVVLLFFGPHCPYSQIQIEEIVKDMNILKNIRFYLLTTVQFEEMKRFYLEYQLHKYPNITVGIDYTNFFGDYFKAKGVPYTAIYGKEKKLKKAFSGAIHSKQIKGVAEEE